MGSIDLTIGGAINRYSGQHYGNIICAQYASNADLNHQYYWNKAEKLDHNIYAKANYAYSDATNIYVDLQRRRIDYIFEGLDENGNSALQEVSLTFFNPKFGLYHDLNETQSLYASFAVANKEPNRHDHVESTPNSRPEHETLYDTEIGYKQKGEKLSLEKLINKTHRNIIKQAKYFITDILNNRLKIKNNFKWKRNAFTKKEFENARKIKWQLIHQK